MKNLLRSVLLILVVSVFTNATAQNFPVRFSFNGYKGNYFIDNYNPIFSGKDTTFLLTAGPHTFGINGYTFAEVNFNVDNAGKVSGISNSVAAYEKDADISYGKAAVVPCIIFNTANVTINPNGAVYCFSAFDNPYPLYQTTGKQQTFRLIKGLGYFIATQFSGNAIKSPDYPDYTIPELFFFNVDAAGKVHPNDAAPVDMIAAQYSGSTLILNTENVTLDPKEFSTGMIRVEGYGNKTVNTTVSYLKGLGRSIRYNSGGTDRYFYFVPM